MSKAVSTGLSKDKFIVEPYSILQADYNDTTPNFFRVQNQGGNPLYCSVTNNPTISNYDFMVDARSTKLYTEPFKKNRLYIYNPSGNSIPITVISFYAEFDPATMALSDLKLDLEGQTIASNTTINSFNTALPSGTNKIGKVDVTSMPPLASGSAVIGSVGVTSLPSVVSDIKTACDTTAHNTLVTSDFLNQMSGVQSDSYNALMSIIGNTDSIYSYLMNTQDGTLNAIRAAIEAGGTGGGTGGGALLPSKKMLKSVSSTTATIYSEPTGKVITKLNFISNDSESNINITLANKDSSIDSGFANTLLTLKPGEVINDIEVRISNFSTSAGALRAMYTVEMDPYTTT